MKFLERFALVVYSYIVLIIAVILSLLIFNWINFDTVSDMIRALLTGPVISKITLAISILFMLLSIKCIFFDERSKEKLKEAQGILLKNENGELMISKDSIDNMVKNAVSGFENVKDCNTKIDVNSENQIIITLLLVVNENVVIKDLASNLQTKVKELEGKKSITICKYCHQHKIDLDLATFVRKKIALLDLDTLEPIYFVE